MTQHRFQQFLYGCIHIHYHENMFTESLSSKICLFWFHYYGFQQSLYEPPEKWHFFLKLYTNGSTYQLHLQIIFKHVYGTLVKTMKAISQIKRTSEAHCLTGNCCNCFIHVPPLSRCHESHCCSWCWHHVEFKTRIWYLNGKRRVHMILIHHSKTCIRQFLP